MVKKILSTLLLLSPYICSDLSGDIFGDRCDTQCDSSCCSSQIKVGGEWLYWKIEQERMNAFTNGEELSRTEEEVFGEINPISPSFKWSSGFRVFGAYEFCDCWELGVIYTYVPSHAKTGYYEASESGFIVFNPSLMTSPVPGENIFAKWAEAKWDLTSNCIDVDISKRFCVWNCLNLRPHIGFRSLWFDQKYKIKGSSNLPEDLNRIDYFASINEKFNGYGVEGGLWADFEIGCGLSLLGHVGGAVLYSKTKTNYNFLFLNFADGEIDFTLNDKFKNIVKVGTPMFDYFLGLKYEDQVCDFDIIARIGWEQHVIFDANKLSTIDPGGNLSGQGLTIGLALGF